MNRVSIVVFVLCLALGVGATPALAEAGPFEISYHSGDVESSWDDPLVSLLSALYVDEGWLR